MRLGEFTPREEDPSAIHDWGSQPVIHYTPAETQEQIDAWGNPSTTPENSEDSITQPDTQGEDNGTE